MLSVRLFLARLSTSLDAGDAIPRAPLVVVLQKLCAGAAQSSHPVCIDLLPLGRSVEDRHRSSFEDALALRRVGMAGMRRNS